MAGGYSVGKEGRSGWKEEPPRYAADVSGNSGALPSRWRERNICSFIAGHQYPMTPTSVFSCSCFFTYTRTRKFKWSIKMPSSKTSTTSLHIRGNNASHKNTGTAPVHCQHKTNQRCWLKAGSLFLPIFTMTNNRHKESLLPRAGQPYLHCNNAARSRVLNRSDGLLH